MRAFREEGGLLQGLLIVLCVIGFGMVLSGIAAGATESLLKGLALIMLGNLIAAGAVRAMRDGPDGRHALRLSAGVTILTFGVMAAGVFNAAGGVWI
jgi:hypothetical protein